LFYPSGCAVSQSHKNTPIQQDPTVYQNFISYLYEAQNVSGDTPPIIRNLKLHWQPLVFHTWKIFGRVVAGRCQAEPDDGRCLARNMLSFI